MQFESSPELQELQHGLRRLLTQRYGEGGRARIAASEAGWSREVWRDLVHLGVAALVAPEAEGGLGGRPIDWLPVLEEAGRVQLLEPLVTSSILAATALRTAAPTSEWLSRICDGTGLVALAHEELGARHAALWVEARAERHGDAWHLHANKGLVLHAASAQAYVVSARVGGSAGQIEGMGLFLVSRDAAGLMCRRYVLLDDTPCGELELRESPATLLAQDAKACAALDAARNAGLAAVVGEAIGVARAAFELTVQHVNTREQFGRLLAANQAVRHRIAEMAVGLDVLESAAVAALLALECPTEETARHDLARAKMMLGRHGVAIVQQAVQLHGGIGMTREYGVGHALRRMTVIDMLFGDAAQHAGELAAAVARSNQRG